MANVMDFLCDGPPSYQVANLPLVPNLPIPKELFEIDQRKIVGLLIDPTVVNPIASPNLCSYKCPKALVAAIP